MCHHSFITQTKAVITSRLVCRSVRRYAVCLTVNFSKNISSPKYVPPPAPYVLPIQPSYYGLNRQVLLNSNLEYFHDQKTSVHNEPHFYSNFSNLEFKTLISSQLIRCSYLEQKTRSEQRCQGFSAILTTIFKRSGSIRVHGNRQ